MRAARIHEFHKGLRVEDAPVPQFGPDEVLVQTRTCGICRTDLHKIDGMAKHIDLPQVLGHEPAGVVAEVGKNVTGLEVGQRVIPHDFFACGRCRYCRLGRDPLCLRPRVLGTTASGGFGEYFAAPVRNLFVLPDHVPFECGGVVSCAVVTAVHAFRRSGIGTNETAVVIGAGNVGQNLIQVLRGAGVRVVALDTSPERLEVASQLGAELTVSAAKNDEAIEEVRAFTAGDGARCAFDVVGLSSTLTAGAECLMRGGRLVVVGEEDECPAINSTQIAQQELEIVGSRNGSRQDLVDAISMVGAGIITPQIAERFPLEDINEALERVRGGKARGKIVVEVSD